MRSPESLVGRDVLVVGMARSGRSAARVARDLGARVCCTDTRADAPVVEGTRAVYGEHRREDFLSADLVIVSPGVPAAQPDVAAAVAAGVEVVGELGFAASLLGDLPILAVSGTNGKSTCTFLLGQLLEMGGRRTFVGGNLGRPLSEVVAQRGELDVAAVEVSSYQMELPGGFHPHAAAILNLTPDHLERHGSMDVYGEHKVRLFQHMGPDDAAILPADEPRRARLARYLPGRRLYLGGRPGVRMVEAGKGAGEVDKLVIDAGPDPGELALEGFPLPGAHNRANLAAAVMLAAWAGVPRSAMDVRALRGLPHRLEPVAEIDGVTWINDSKATNVDSTLVALAAMGGARGRPTVVLLGGRAKARAPWSGLLLALGGARAVVCFGEAGPEIAEALEAAGQRVERAAGLREAVAVARRLAEPGDVVLLSPACASFDEFQDFEHRGRVFSDLVRGKP